MSIKLVELGAAEKTVLEQSLPLALVPRDFLVDEFGIDPASASGTSFDAAFFDLLDVAELRKKGIGPQPYD